VTNTKAFAIRKFDGKNFIAWKSQILAYLQIKDCHDAIYMDQAVAPGDATARAQAFREFDMKNNMAKGILLLSSCDDQAVLVCHLQKAKVIWDRLLEAYESIYQLLVWLISGRRRLSDWLIFAYYSNTNMKAFLALLAILSSRIPSDNHNAFRRTTGWPLIV
jgi:hypothetical protein